MRLWPSGIENHAVDAHDPPRVLLLVEPDLLGHLLARILISAGEDEVTNVPHQQPVPIQTSPFSAAVVSAPLAAKAEAALVIELPGAGETVGVVRTATTTASVEMTGPYGVLEALDRFCPTARRRTVAASRWRTDRPVTAKGG